MHVHTALEVALGKTKYLLIILLENHLVKLNRLDNMCCTAVVLFAFT